MPVQKHQKSARKDKYAQFSDCSCDMARKTARKITQIYERHLQAANIKVSQFSVLATLANNGPLLLSQLAAHLMLDRTGLSRNLAVLERNGWVQAQTGAQDQRQRVISLTEVGYEKLDLAIPHWQQAQQLIAQELGKGPTAGLSKTLNAITKIAT